MRLRVHIHLLIISMRTCGSAWFQPTSAGSADNLESTSLTRVWLSILVASTFIVIHLEFVHDGQDSASHITLLVDADDDHRVAKGPGGRQTLCQQKGFIY